MGRMQAEEFATAVEDGGISLEAALRWHLGSNHYPPVLFMADAALEAIEAGNDEDWDREIQMPDGVRYRGSDSAPASSIIESLHLESFLS